MGLCIILFSIVCVCVCVCVTFLEQELLETSLRESENSLAVDSIQNAEMMESVRRSEEDHMMQQIEEAVLRESQQQYYSSFQTNRG